ncbi:MAG: DUF2007 domain-containing protein [Chloroflexota bacterium]|nr:DUF2007 domain-containing protein [Chloroflexota bacterium]MDE2948366.1 DUF2007 domain-containing protein [Chloroflexota bacterium]
MSLRKRDGGVTGPDWIAVYITHNLPEAHIIAGKLRAYEIPAMIHKEAGAAAIGITLGNLGEIKVLVSPADYERAADVLFPAPADQIEASNEKVRLIWQDDDDAPKPDDNEEE